MNKPKVSVIIPVYNTEAYVEEAVRSIMTQTLRDIEILVVDDGSTDQSLTILERLAKEDDRITLISQPNSGQAVARNTGLTQAKGTYIYFMDSDDLLESEALEACEKYCTENQLDFVFFDAESFGEEHDDETAPWFNYRRAARYPNIGKGDRLFERMVHDNTYRCSVCMHLFRKELLDHMGLHFYAGIIHEDELFTAQAYLEAERVGSIARDFFHRRVRAESTMTTLFSERNVNGYLTVIRELNRFASTRGRRAKKLVGHLCINIMAAMMTNAWQLPMKVRWSIAREAFRHLPHRIPVKPLCILLFKKYFKSKKK